MNSMPFSIDRDIKDLIHNSLKKILGKKDENIEIEARLGIIMDKVTGSRIDINAQHPFIFSTKNSPFIFKSGVQIQHFEKLLTLFNDCQQEKTEETVVINNKVRKIYEGGELKESMEKVRINTYEIHFPNANYDIRIAISKETPIKEVGRFVDKKNIIRRDRTRVSVPIDTFRCDLTKINNVTEDSFEVELEVVDPTYDSDLFFAILQKLII